jgi:hypothetical protein
MKFKIEMSGDRIKKGQVPFDILGKFLIEFQGLINVVAEATSGKPSNPKRRKEFYEDLKLFATDIEAGSAKVIVATQDQTTIEGMLPILDPLQKSLGGVETIQELDEDQSFLKIEKDPSLRSRIFPRHGSILNGRSL